MQRSDIPTKFNIPWANAAGGGYVRSVPEASQIGVHDGYASLTDGFPPLCFTPVGSGGTPPFGQDMNGILKQVTAWLQYYGAGGLPAYDSAFSTAIGGYPLGTILSAASPGAIWLNLVDNNTTDPDTGGANWASLNATISVNSIAAAVQGQTWVYEADTGTANALSISPTPPVTSYTTGQRWTVKKASHDNSTTTPTVVVSGLAPKVIVRADGTTIQVGDLPAGGIFDLVFDGTNFRLMELPPSASRIRLTADRTFYVATTGSDSSGNGTSGSPWATIQYAFNAIYAGYDLAGWQVTIHLAHGTYTDGVLWEGPFLGQLSPILIIGDQASPTSVVVDVTTASCFHARFGAHFKIIGFQVRCRIVDTAFGAMMCEWGGYIEFDYVYFDDCSTCNHLYSAFGVILCTGHYWIIGGGVSHFCVALGGNIDVGGAVVVLSGTPSFTTFANMSSGNLRSVSAGFTGGATGQRYLSQYGGLINTGGGGVNFFPGNSAGSAPNGYYI